MAQTPENVSVAPLVTEGTCELLGEFGTFGWWLQGLLGVLSLGSLFAKRWKEKPRRPWRIFLFDSFKQASGAFFVHMLNLGNSWFMAAVYEHDACVWYWLNIMVDTTLGVYFQYLLLSGARRLLKGASFLEYGYYGSPPRVSACLSQAASWQVFCLLMKIAACLFMAVLQKPLIFISTNLLAAVDPYPKAKLFVVMIATPLVMNSLQYWLTDNFIKKQTPATRDIPVYNVVGEAEVVAGCSRND